MKKSNLPILLVILDGWGHSNDLEHNSIHIADTKCFDNLVKNYPSTLIDASETFVGLPTGQMGNSEVGHMTIGSGKVLDVDLVRINKAIEDGSFHNNETFEELFSHIKAYDSTLHIMGLLSPGGIHSHQLHMHEFLKLAKSKNIHRIAIHIFTDGRDVPPTSAYKYIQELEDLIKDLGIGYIASMQGRFYAMDRDSNWDRIKKTEDTLVKGLGNIIKNQKDPSDIIKDLYKENIIDEMLEPIVFLDDKNKPHTIKDNDGVFLFNFRADRSRQISEKILELKKEFNLMFVTMTKYSNKIESNVVFPPISIHHTLASEISNAGLSQSHIAETEKYAHVTYFFNGGFELLHKNENHILINSRKDIQTHDEAPEMMAKEITKAVVQELDKGTDLIIVNYANADMVGHTAHVDALKIAIETVDKQLSILLNKIEEKNGIMIVTADHGNAEQNYDKATNQKHTSHTINPVPFIITKKDLNLRNGGTLADITPTILDLLDITKPDSMDGVSLVKK